MKSSRSRKARLERLPRHQRRYHPHGRVPDRGRGRGAADPPRKPPPRYRPAFMPCAPSAAASEQRHRCAAGSARTLICPGERHRPGSARQRLRPGGSNTSRACARRCDAAAPGAAANPKRPTACDSRSRSVERMARLAEAVGREPKKRQRAPWRSSDVRSGLDAFCRGAGIDAESLPAEAQGRLLHLAGRLFREALVGFKELERTRADTRNRYRIECSPRRMRTIRVPRSPTPWSRTCWSAVLQRHERPRLDSVQWLRETVARSEDSRTGDRRASDARRLRRVSRSPGSSRARGALRARGAPRQGPRGRQGAVLGDVHHLLPQSHRNAG